MSEQAAQTIPELLRATASAHPATEAVVEGERRLTYSQLEAEVSRLAAGLAAFGIEPGQTVAVWAPNSTEWIVSMLAIAQVGGVLVPLNTRFQGPEAEYVLRRSRARLLLTVGAFLGRSYPSMIRREEVPDLQDVVLMESLDSLASQGRTPEWEAEAARRSRRVQPSDWLDLMFTSGTTGHPKGVRARHGDTIRSFRFYAANLGITHGDRYLLVNPLFHTFGSKAGVVAALTAGATLYPVPVFDPGAAARLIAAERSTVVPGPPTIYHSLLQLPPEARSSLRSLRLAVTGAAAVPVDLLKRMETELGFDVVLTAYGLTETIGLVTMCRVGDPPEVVSSTSGRAIPG
ncbi:MAG TPA: AMP-binding protein, partial [Acidimicrobiales bacterium]|nr:AMP-binding protein [Acidimicrobiales bacterium]